MVSVIYFLVFCGVIVAAWLVFAGVCLVWQWWAERRSVNRRFNARRGRQLVTWLHRCGGVR